MKFILNIYIRDSRTKSGRRLVKSQSYECENTADMSCKIENLKKLYSADNGYIIETVIEK